MLKRSFLSLAVVFVCSLACTSVNGADTSVQDEPRLYTNQDIEKYKNPPESGPTETKSISQEDRGDVLNDGKKRSMEEHEKEYWCKKASTYKKKIEKADVDVKEIEKELSTENGRSVHSGKKTAELQKRLEKAQKKVKEAEADLDDLEHEAHRKGIPPGWLRCQT